MDYAELHYYISLALRQYKMRQALFLSPCPSTQNHRLAEVRNDLWKSSGPTFLLKQGHLEQVTEECPDGFWVPPGRETPHPPWIAYSSVWSHLQ